jgi:hypothetical protein
VQIVDDRVSKFILQLLGIDLKLGHKDATIKLLLVTCLVSAIWFQLADSMRALSTPQSIVDVIRRRKYALYAS